MFNPAASRVRRQFCDAWRKHLERSIVEGAEATAIDIIPGHRNTRRCWRAATMPSPVTGHLKAAR